MKQLQDTLFRMLILTLLLVVCATGSLAQEAKSKGLIVSYSGVGGSASGASVMDVDSGVHLRVEAGGAPSPFIPLGPFVATWEGFLNVPLRDYYTFSVKGSGKIELDINGKRVLEGEAVEGWIQTEDETRLGKGENSIRLRLESLGDGSGAVRLYWKGYDFEREPVPDLMFTRDNPDELGLALERAHGRSIVLEHRCLKCHQANEDWGVGTPEWGYDAPSFIGIGSRREIGFLKQWILDPHSIRPQARMPKLVHGEVGVKQAGDIAVYLHQLKEAADSVDSVEGGEVTAEILAEGARFFQELHCGACHSISGLVDAEENKISLDHLKTKFRIPNLVSFLRKPNRHYQWSRMPNFHLTEDESLALAGYLFSIVPTGHGTDKVEGNVDEGRRLVSTLGCLQCHKGEDQTSTYQAPALALLKDWSQGCLADEAQKGVPFFGFAEADRAALRKLAEGDLAALGRHVTTDFSHRHLNNLNCLNCHGRFEGFPSMPNIEGKLQADWMGAFIRGDIPDRPREWLTARMPGFEAFGSEFAKGMALGRGYPSRSEVPQEGKAGEDWSDIGRTLIGVDGGFACIACHGVNELKPMQVFESQGINLGYAKDRLQPEYLHRWLLNPLRIDPTTKMPLYFDGVRSPLTQYLEGDALKQIEAVWQYLLKGKDMVPPHLP